MKKVCKLLILLGLGSLLGCESEQIETRQTKTVSHDKIDFEEQIAVFENLGFKLLDRNHKENILELWQDEYEHNPFDLLYYALGLTSQYEPYAPFSNKCWTFDLEAIEDQGDYIDIIENLSRISNGELDFENIKDYVDIEEEKAWVSFSCNNENYKWDLTVDNDWADGKLFDMVQGLTKKYNTRGRYTYFTQGGQDFVVGYHSPDELEEIRSKTGLRISWLKAKGQIY